MIMPRVFGFLLTVKLSLSAELPPDEPEERRPFKQLEKNQIVIPTVCPYCVLIFICGVASLKSTLPSHLESQLVFKVRPVTLQHSSHLHVALTLLVIPEWLDIKQCRFIDPTYYVVSNVFNYMQI